MNSVPFHTTLPFPTVTVAGKDLQMCKKRTDIEHAREINRLLIHKETRGSGDIVAAMRRIARRHNVDFWFMWALRYRPPRDVLMKPYRALEAAYEAECARQLKLVRHEIEITEKIAGSDCPAVRKVKALVR